MNKSARVFAASLLKKAKTGEMTNWQLEDSWPDAKDDPALNCILRWIWTLYDDGSETRSMKELSLSDLKIFNRCLDFLETHIEFPTKRISHEEAILIRKKWGVEWRPDCTCPSDCDLLR